MCFEHMPSNYYYEMISKRNFVKTLGQNFKESLKFSQLYQEMNLRARGSHRTLLWSINIIAIESRPSSSTFTLNPPEV